MSVTDGIGQTPCSLEHYLVQSATRRTPSPSNHQHHIYDTRRKRQHMPRRCQASPESTHSASYAWHYDVATVSVGPHPASRRRLFPVSVRLACAPPLRPDRWLPPHRVPVSRRHKAAVRLYIMKRIHHSVWPVGWLGGTTGRASDQRPEGCGFEAY